MFEKPLLHNLSEKTYDIAILVLVIIMYAALCAEADMYVPAFPQMIDYFGIGENQIQLILSINFAGFCVAGLVVGPLSDSFGRKIVLIIGLLLFLISSLGCALTTDFTSMLIWRLLQGIAASAPAVVVASIFLDKYSGEKAGQLIGFMNSFISASMAGAPIIGAWISTAFDWRANFVVILALSIISFLGTLFFIGETLPASKRRKFSFLEIYNDYTKLLKNFKFIGYSVIVNFPFACIVVYIANLSVILINHMGVSIEKFGYYQASTMGTFIIFSLWSVKIIGKKGIDYTKNLGGALALIGAAGMFYVGLIDKTSISMICLSMAFIAAGGALMSGTFSIKILSLFPDMSGTSMAMLTAIRQLMSVAFVVLSEIFFDGTIVPVSMIIFGCGAVSTIAYFIIATMDVKSAQKKIRIRHKKIA